MPYLGNTPTANFASVTKDTFSGNGSTTAFTLSKPATTNGVAVYVENVRQIPTTAYAVSGTTLTFTGAPVSGTNNIYVMHHNTPVSTATHPAAQDLTCAGFTSTGIDDNADATAITIDSSEDVTLSGDLSSGLNKSIDLRDNDGHVSGRLRNISSSKNALVIEADPDNSGSNSNLRFYIDGSEQAIIDNNYDFKVNNGDIFFGTAGKGIVLGATSNTNANTLEDYEEGTWTPSTPINMTAAEGTYVKVGNLVTAHFNVTFPASSDSGTIALMAGPFNSGGANKYGGGFLTYENALDSGNQTIMMYNQAANQFVFVSGNTGLTLADVSGHQFLGTLVYTT